MPQFVAQFLEVLLAPLSDLRLGELAAFDLE